MDFLRRRLARLQDLKRQRPQFGEIFDFYELLSRFLERESPSFLTVAPTPHNRELRRREGFPLLDGGSLRLDPKPAAAFLDRLAGFLQVHGPQGKEELGAIRHALQAGRLDLPAAFRACLERDRTNLQTTALAAGAPPALVEYVFDTALSFALQKAREEGLTAATEDWPHGWCPLCGGLPAMGELTGEEGRKVLHCATCATFWPFSRLCCPTCGNDDPASLEYFTAEGEKAHRVDVCRRCSCYLKVVDSRQSGSGLPMDIEDIATLHLDLLAQKEGFTRGKKPGRSGE